MTFAGVDAKSWLQLATQEITYDLSRRFGPEVGQGLVRIQGYIDNAQRAFDSGAENAIGADFVQSSVQDDVHDCVRECADLLEQACGLSPYEKDTAERKVSADALRPIIERLRSVLPQ